MTHVSHSQRKNLIGPDPKVIYEHENVMKVLPSIDCPTADKERPPQGTWRRTVEKETRNGGWTWEQRDQMATDRNQWRCLSEALCTSTHETDLLMVVTDRFPRFPLWSFHKLCYENVQFLFVKKERVKYAVDNVRRNPKELGKRAGNRKRGGWWLGGEWLWPKIPRTPDIPLQFSFSSRLRKGLVGYDFQIVTET